MTKRKRVIRLPHTPTDEELALAVVSGRREYYKELVKRYHKKLLLYLRHLIGSGDEAEDLLQNVFVKTYENLRRFDQDRKFSSWIYRIAHNEAVNYLKKKSRRRTVSWEDIVSVKDKIDTADTKDSPEASRVRKELRREVRFALDRLPKKYREVIVLKYFLGKSYREMSDITGRPQNTVATLLNRAKKRLLVTLNKEGKL